MDESWQNEGWHSDVLDDEGNYYRNESAYDLPDAVSRGGAGQRLDMNHGFLRHIVRCRVTEVLTLVRSSASHLTALTFAATPPKR